MDNIINDLYNTIEDIYMEMDKLCHDQDEIKISALYESSQTLIDVITKLQQADDDIVL